jgi:predicted O-linked N-acetylglucosamine transferase (SPINDLY family)
MTKDQLPSSVVCHLSAVRRDLALEPGLAPALAELGRGAAETAWLLRALASDPLQLEALINLGALAVMRGERSTALAALARALALKPDAASAWINLGGALGLSAAAVPAFRRALALEPEAGDAAVHVADALRAGDPLIAAVPAYRRALALLPGEPRLFESLAFALAYDPDAVNAEILMLNRRWASLLEHAPAVPHDHDRDPDAADAADAAERRLRIGYLSADLYDHPVGRNLVGLVEHHDAQAVEACLYALNGGAGDAVTARLRAAASLWREVGGLDDRALASRIGADRIDVLVVLAGHTPFNRLAVAALKPAPVQIAMHDVASSGLDAIDAVFGDATLMPDDGEFLEEVVRLPCFYLHDRLPEVALSPAHAGAGAAGGVAEDAVMLGSCSNPGKLNDRVIALWAEILRHLPQARLMLKYRDRFGDPLVRRRWLERMAAAGIGGDRLVFRTGAEELAEHLAVLGGIDIAFDPFPFNGCTTTYEALWMGVPVVTLKGRRFVGRAGQAMLERVGLGDLVAADEAAYVETVLDLARDGPRRARLRGELRGRLRASALLDAPACAREVEAAYRRLWRRRNQKARSQKPEGQKSDAG